MNQESARYPRNPTELPHNSRESRSSGVAGYTLMWIPWTAFHWSDGFGRKMIISEHTYLAAATRLRLPLKIAVFGEAVSVQQVRYESSAVIAGIPNVLPIARQDKPS